MARGREGPPAHQAPTAGRETTQNTNLAQNQAGSPAWRTSPDQAQPAPTPMLARHAVSHPAGASSCGVPGQVSGKKATPCRRAEVPARHLGPPAEHRLLPSDLAAGSCLVAWHKLAPCVWPSSVHAPSHATQQAAWNQPNNTPGAPALTSLHQPPNPSSNSPASGGWQLWGARSLGRRQRRAAGPGCQPGTRAVLWGVACFPVTRMPTAAFALGLLAGLEAAGRRCSSQAAHQAASPGPLSCPTARKMLYAGSQY